MEKDKITLLKGVFVLLYFNTNKLLIRVIFDLYLNKFFNLNFMNEKMWLRKITLEMVLVLE